jgi:hypothetical protein
MQHAWERWEMLKKKPKCLRGRLVDLGMDRRIMIKSTQGKKFVGAWSGFSWLKIGSTGRLL